MKKQVKPFTKALAWAVVFTVTAALQALILWILSEITDNHSYAFNNLFLDGSPIFFSMSICCSIVFEYCIDAEMLNMYSLGERSRYWGLLAVIILVVGMVVSMVIYSAIVLSGNHLVSKNLVNTEEILVVTSFLFAIRLKFIIYKYQKLSSKL